MASWQSHILHRVVRRQLQGNRAQRERRAKRAVPERISPESMARLRDNFERMGRLPQALQPSVTPMQLAHVPGERHVPRRVQARTILYFHGGGYAMGSPASYRRLTAHLGKAARAEVLSMNYRLAPEHPFPAGLDDAYDAWMALIATVDPQRCVVAGDSAGGGLVAALLDRLRASGDPMPAAAYLISPWVDLTMSGASVQTFEAHDPMVQARFLPLLAAQYAGPIALHNPGVSPLFADPQRWPPVRIDVGGLEVLLDDSTRLAARVRDVGGQIDLTVWPGMMHVFPYFASVLPEGRRALKQAGRFVQQHTPV